VHGLRGDGDTKCGLRGNNDHSLGDHNEGKRTSWQRRMRRLGSISTIAAGARRWQAWRRRPGADLVHKERGHMPPLKFWVSKNNIPSFM
jgi:hypothetical protein